MTKHDEGTVIVQFDEHGELTYHVQGNTRLYIVDERAPHDRVYEWLPRATSDEIAEIIPVGEVIGSGQDERAEVLSHRIKAAISHVPHLAVVRDDRP